MRSWGWGALLALTVLADACGGRAARMPGTGGAAGAEMGGAGGQPAPDSGQAAPDVGGTGGATADGTAPPDDASIGPDASVTFDANRDIPDCRTRHAGTRLPPDLLLVMDRSGSMQEDPATALICMPQATCPSKWNQAVAAISQVVGDTQDRIRWGLKLFQTGTTACGVIAGASIPIALMNGMTITDALHLTAPSGSTPTTAAITAGGDYLSTLTTPNPRSMVLVTDGQPTCGPGGMNAADDENAILALQTQSALGFGTFVVGVATAGNALADLSLTRMATAGKRVRAGPTNYYSINDAAELAAALTSIATLAGTCTFALDSGPPPVGVEVEGDGVRIPFSTTNGWTYGSQQRFIVLSGTYCDRVQAGTLHDVVMIVGCSP